MAEPEVSNSEDETPGEPSSPVAESGRAAPDGDGRPAEQAEPVSDLAASISPNMGRISQQAAAAVGLNAPALDADRRAISTAGIGRAADDAAQATRLAEASRRLVESPGAVSQLSSFQFPAVENLQRLQADRARQQEKLAEGLEAIDREKRRRAERDDAQAEATIEMAERQRELAVLQARGLDLAEQQAAATAEVARSQQDMLGAIQQELEVLRDQHQTLREQVRGQERLIHSGWSGGVVMEWTLFVAIIAALATVTFAVQPAGDLGWPFWVVAAVACVAIGLALATWQRRTRPGPGTS